MLDGPLDKGLCEGLKLEPVFDGSLKRGDMILRKLIAKACNFAVCNTQQRVPPPPSGG